MEIIGVQIIAILFAAFMVYLSFIHYKKGEINSRVYWFWIIVWLGFIIFALFPTFLEPLVKRLKIIRVMDLLMVTAFMILTYIGFENFVSTKKSEKKIEDLVRNLALKEFDKKKKRAK